MREPKPDLAHRDVRRSVGYRKRESRSIDETALLALEPFAGLASGRVCWETANERDVGIG